MEKTMRKSSYAVYRYHPRNFANEYHTIHGIGVDIERMINRLMGDYDSKLTRVKAYASKGEAEYAAVNKDENAMSLEEFVCRWEGNNHRNFPGT